MLKMQYRVEVFRALGDTFCEVWERVVVPLVQASFPISQETYVPTCFCICQVLEDCHGYLELQNYWSEIRTIWMVAWIDSICWISMVAGAGDGRLPPAFWCSYLGGGSKVFRLEHIEIVQGVIFRLLYEEHRVWERWQVECLRQIARLLESSRAIVRIDDRWRLAHCQNGVEGTPDVINEIQVDGWSERSVQVAVESQRIDDFISYFMRDGYFDEGI
jgi:hypothetical protein